MDTKMMVGLGFMIFASLTTQLPYVMFRHHPKLSGSELAGQHPELAWIRIVYPILSILWFLVFGLVPLFWIMRSVSDLLVPFQATFYILGGAIGSTSILHGILGLVTNVCPIPRKRGALYVHDEGMYSNALLLMAAGIFVIIIALAMIFFNML